MKFSLPLALALVPWLSSPALAQAKELPEEVVRSIEDRCNERLWTLYEERGFAGLSAALVLPDGSVLSFPVGSADVEAEVDMAPEHRLLSGSIGKTYVTAAAHHLALAGKLSFDDRAAKYFEGAAWLERVPNAKEVTIRQLLRHESGLPRYVFKPDFFPTCVENPDKAWTPEELLAWVFDDDPVHAPGEGWAYSDTNFLVVGMVIEKVSGTTFYDYVREHLLEPNGLRDTVPSDSREIEGLTQGYCVSLRSFGVPERVLEDGVFAYNPQFEWCGGGYASTPSDLARWGFSLYRGEAMEGDYLATMLDTVPAQLGPGKEYGLGVMVRETPLGRQIGHDGIMTGFLATMAYFDGAQIAGSLMLNTDDQRALGTSPERLLEELASIAAEELAN